MKLLTVPTLVLILCSLDVSAQPEVSGPVPPQGTVAAPEAGGKPSSDPNPEQDASRPKTTEENAAAKPSSLKDYCRKHTC